MAKYPADLAIIVSERLQREKIIPPDLTVITKFLEVIYFVSLKTEESEHVMSGAGSHSWTRMIRSRIRLLGPDPTNGRWSDFQRGYLSIQEIS